MRTLCLNGAWKFKEVPAGAAVADELESGEWLSATVPGCVHTDLMAAGKIPDPFYRMNEREAAWVAEKDWLYVKSFELDGATLALDRVELVCNGLDTFATIALNGREIAKTENAFVEHTFDVTDCLREGPNTLAIRFESSDRITAERKAKFGHLPGGQRGYARKPQYATGWDWGPTLPSCGISQTIFLRAFSAGRIESVFAPAAVRDGQGAVGLLVDLARTDEAPLTVNATLSSGGQEVASVEVHDAGVRCEAVLNAEKPILWWPAGLGDPELYDLSIRLRKGDEELDRRDMRIGFRSIELEREADDAGESFIFKVNGRRIFCKGANWVPADSFPWRITPEKYRRLLEMAVDQNMNMLRVWGGGIYEPDVFFDVCDELGLLIWHDFMFSCGDYPDRDWFQSLVADEAKKFVKRVRNHPCLALYCGNNENQWGFEEWNWGDTFTAEKIYNEILPETCRRLDPTRTYWPGSPYGGSSANSESHGDCHNWAVWHGSMDAHVYLESRPRFVSEFGYQSFPTMETVREFAEPEDFSINGEVMASHQKCGTANERIKDALGTFLGEPGSFERTVLFSQILQGDALKTGIEHWRRQKWHTSGTLIWQLNDCWPVISWATVDYNHRPKPAYYYVRRLYAPLLITAHVDDGQVVVTGINDTDRVVSGTLDVELFDVRGEAHLLHTGGVVIPADGVCELCSFPVDKIPNLDDARQFIWATFYSGLYNSSATCFFADAKNLELPEPNIMVEVEADEFDAQVLIRLTSPVFVKGVWLSLAGREARFSDNAFDLIPYVSREVTVQVEGGISREALDESLRVLHCNRLRQDT